MPVLLVVLASVLLVPGIVGYLVTGMVWFLVLAGLGVVAGAGGWVVTRDGVRPR